MGVMTLVSMGGCIVFLDPLLHLIENQILIHFCIIGREKKKDEHFQKDFQIIFKIVQNSNFIDSDVQQPLHWYVNH